MKNWMLLICLACVSFSLTACGDDDNDEPGEVCVDGGAGDAGYSDGGC